MKDLIRIETSVITYHIESQMVMMYRAVERHIDLFHEGKEYTDGEKSSIEYLKLMNQHAKQEVESFCAMLRGEKPKQLMIGNRK